MNSNTDDTAVAASRSPGPNVIQITLVLTIFYLTLDGLHISYLISSVRWHTLIFASCTFAPSKVVSISSVCDQKSGLHGDSTIGSGMPVHAFETTITLHLV